MSHPTTQITLYGDESEWFQDIKADIARDRNGVEPSNAEAVRKLMEQSPWG